MLLDPSTVTVLGTFIVAKVAAAPSPVVDAVPVPATVVMIPDVSTLRILLLPLSAMYPLPKLSKATSQGALKVADVAAPVSPVEPVVPVPAQVVMTPVAMVIFRTRFPDGSAM